VPAEAFLPAAPVARWCSNAISRWQRHASGNERLVPGLRRFDIRVGATTIHGVCGGQGPPLLLLHGIREMHLMWRLVAPALSETFTVVATDLRGFGASGTPPSEPNHSPYSMPELARDQVAVMQDLGHRRFFVAGHDPGARCAYRMPLDGVFDLSSTVRR
jgi:haloacetate dehalogenase